MKKFSEVYGLATQLMNIGGNLLNNAQGNGGGRSVYASSSSAYGGNGILGEVVKPQFRGASNFESSNYDNRPSKVYGSSTFSEYGGGPLGSGSRSQPRSILDTLMGSFLGSSIGPSSGSTSSIFSPTYEEYGGTASRYGSPKQGSNIEAIVDALSRTGAKRAEPSEFDGNNPGSFLSQFFG